MKQMHCLIFILTSLNIDKVLYVLWHKNKIMKSLPPQRQLVLSSICLSVNNVV